MKTVMILGGGFMGSGITQVCANGGLDTILWDISLELAEKGKARIASGLDARIAKGKETEEHKNELLGRIRCTDDISAAAEADMIIEVVVEKMEIKKDVIAKIEKHCRPDAIISTNTSYLSISEMSEVLEKPERFLGTHFFGPVPAMKLLEIIKGKHTSDAAVAAAREFAALIGKTPVLVNKDNAGFLVNRINAALRMEAYRCYEEGIASIEDIDTAMKLGLNHPMGPFELNDMSGIEIGLSGLDTIYAATGDERWKAINKARELVEAGELGRKTGKGWYDYSSGEKKARNDL